MVKIRIITICICWRVILEIWKKWLFKEFNSVKTNLWDQFTLMELALLKNAKLYTDQKRKATSHLIFLWIFEMILNLLGNILYCTHLLNLNSVVNELLNEEIKFKSHFNLISNKKLSTLFHLFFAAFYSQKKISS